MWKINNLEPARKRVQNFELYDFFRFVELFQVVIHMLLLGDICVVQKNEFFRKTHLPVGRGFVMAQEKMKKINYVIASGYRFSCVK